MAFANVTLTDPQVYTALVGHCKDIVARAFGADSPQGVDAAGHPIQHRGVGAPLPEAHHEPRLLDVSVVDVTDLAPLCDYVRTIARMFVDVFLEKTGSTGGVVLANITPATGGSAVVDTLTAVRAELNTITTYWNANVVQLQIPPALAAAAVTSHYTDPNFPLLVAPISLS